MRSRNSSALLALSLLATLPVGTHSPTFHRYSDKGDGYTKKPFSRPDKKLKKGAP